MYSTSRSHGHGSGDQWHPSLNRQFAYQVPRDPAAGLVHQLGNSSLPNDSAHNSTRNFLFAPRYDPCLDLHLENLNLGAGSSSSSSNSYTGNYDHIDRHRNPHNPTRTGSSNYGITNRPNPGYGLSSFGNPFVGQFPTRYDHGISRTNNVCQSNSAYCVPSLLSSRAGDLSVFELMTANSGITFRNLLDDPEYQNSMAEIVTFVTSDAEDFFEVAKDSVGILSVMKLIVVVSTSPVLCGRVTCALAERVIDVMLHPTACCLVSHCLENLMYHQNSFLYEAALKDYYKLAKNRIGSESLINCIKYSRANYQTKFFKKIIQRSVDLAKHPIGNYLVQSVIMRYDLKVSEGLCFYLKGHLEELSLDSHGSHVIEKCLLSSGGKQILQELVSLGREKLKELASDRYGNYVIQTALKTKDCFLRSRLHHNVKQITAELNYSPSTSKLINLLRDF